MLARPLIDACSAASYARPSNAGLAMRGGNAGGLENEIAKWEELMQRRWLSAAAILASFSLVVACTPAPAGGGGTDKGEKIGRAHV